MSTTQTIFVLTAALAMLACAWAVTWACRIQAQIDAWRKAEEYGEPASDQFPQLYNPDNAA
jgi:hypothetical protein